MERRERDATWTFLKRGSNQTNFGVCAVIQAAQSPVVISRIVLVRRAARRPQAPELLELFVSLVWPIQLAVKLPQQVVARR